MWDAWSMTCQGRGKRVGRPERVFNFTSQPEIQLEGRKVREKKDTQRLIHTQTQREKRARARLARARARKKQSQRVIQTHFTDTNTTKLTRCHQRACSETLEQPTSCFLRACVCVFLLCVCLLRVHQKMRAARSVAPKCVCLFVCLCVLTLCVIFAFLSQNSTVSDFFLYVCVHRKESPAQEKAQCR